MIFCDFFTKFGFKNRNFVFLDELITDMDLENSIPLKLGDYYIPIKFKLSIALKVPCLFTKLGKTVSINLSFFRAYILYSFVKLVIFINELGGLGGDSEKN